jgi:phospholipid/cholesterol/gamma-HCH transport system permease protein
MPGEPTPAAMEFVAPDTWNLSGHWTALGIGALARRLGAEPAPRPARGERGERPVVDGGRVEALDSVGAMLIERWLARMPTAATPAPAGGARDVEPRYAADMVGRAAPGVEPHRTANTTALAAPVSEPCDAADTANPAAAAGFESAIEWRNWRPEHRALIERMSRQPEAVPATPPPAPPVLVRLGEAAWTVVGESTALLALVGESARAIAQTIRHPARARWRQTLHHVGGAGLAAMPIVGLLSLLMGIVVAYQSAEQLRRYGANVFVVDLVAISMLREFAPLVTAIIIAGRSGAAFAAQLGTMAVTEEIDALRVLGIAPVELLVLPRLFALVVALPLLTMFSDVMGVIGGMVMARAKLGVSYAAFVDRLPHAIEMSTLWVGLFKAPVFAAIVTLVGCFQGLQTAGGADSVGRHTTRAVVHAIFLIIVADALFSVVFSLLDL